MRVEVDAIGNTIAELPGRDPRATAIGFGSHLDSVRHGGRFDGIVGVVGAVEVIELLSDSGYEGSHPLRVVVFAGEEGARFGEPCVGSKAVVGTLRGRDLEAMRDADGTSLAAALRAIGMDPDSVDTAIWDPAEWAGFIELHIEQASVLERRGIPVGVVDSVSGSTRLWVELSGRADHSGGTPMSMRADALAAAAEVILLAEATATAPANRGARLTVGHVDVHPNGITTIPGHVRLSLDVRDIDPGRQRRLVVQIVDAARRRAAQRGVHLTAAMIADTQPTVLPVWIREEILRACDDVGVRRRVLTSGASHDAQVLNAIVPAGMIFVPSRDGLSHVPEEWTSSTDIARGVDVLLRTIVSLDQHVPSARAVA
jgi:allantoate deiminase